jgi:hypothetical protein
MFFGARNNFVEIAQNLIQRQIFVTTLMKLRILFTIRKRPSSRATPYARLIVMQCLHNVSY